jgi:hypothetical protein
VARISWPVSHRFDFSAPHGEMLAGLFHACAFSCQAIGENFTA